MTGHGVLPNKETNGAGRKRPVMARNVVYHTLSKMSSQKYGWFQRAACGLPPRQSGSARGQAPRLAAARRRRHWQLVTSVGRQEGAGWPCAGSIAKSPCRLPRGDACPRHGRQGAACWKPWPRCWLCPIDRHWRDASGTRRVYLPRRSYASRMRWPVLPGFQRACWGAASVEGMRPVLVKVERMYSTSSRGMP
jgi:hypothetical protein